MSTRSQLRFVQRVDQDGDPTDDDRVAQVYRHSDGYPGSVLRDLAQLKELPDATRAERGPGYTAATFVFLDKLSTVDLYLDGDPLVDAFEASGNGDVLVVLDHPPTAEVMGVLLEQRMLEAFPDTVLGVSVSVSETGELCASY